MSGGSLSPVPTSARLLAKRENTIWVNAILSRAVHATANGIGQADPLTASIRVAAVVISGVLLLAGVGPSALPLRSELAEIQSAQEPFSLHAVVDYDLDVNLAVPAAPKIFRPSLTAGLHGWIASARDGSQDLPADDALTLRRAAVEAQLWYRRGPLDGR